MYETIELGPPIGTRITPFNLYDGERKLRGLQDVMGERGVLLGFIGDIWMPSTVRRILWLQRHARKFVMLGVDVALLVRDQQHTLTAFQLSVPVPMEFPLLADTDGAIQDTCGMNGYAGMLLLTPDGKIRDKWVMPDDRLWPRVQELVEAIRMLEVAA